MSESLKKLHMKKRRKNSYLTPCDSHTIRNRTHKKKFVWMNGVQRDETTKVSRLRPQAPQLRHHHITCRREGCRKAAEGLVCKDTSNCTITEGLTGGGQCCVEVGERGLRHEGPSDAVPLCRLVFMSTQHRLELLQKREH